MVKTPIYGLVLTGGKSTRMKKDKAALKFHGKPQAQYVFELLALFCDKVFISSRKEQASTYKKYPQIHDLKKFSGKGPLSGILSAMAKYPQAAWLVLACDLPFVDDKTIKHLMRYRDPKKIATAYRSRFNDLPEPLCAIYEPKVQRLLLDSAKKDINCPRKILINSGPRLLKLKNKKALDNINTPEEYQQAVRCLDYKNIMHVKLLKKNISSGLDE